MAEALNSPGVEEWRVVPSMPEMLASSWGRIVRKPHKVKMPNGGARLYSPKPTYGFVVSAKKGAKHTYRGTNYRGIGNVKVHRLVCEAFHGSPPEGKNMVIHINEDAHDNRPQNLKWGTQKENMNAPGYKAWARSITGENHPRYKARMARLAREAA